MKSEMDLTIIAKMAVKAVFPNGFRIHIDGVRQRVQIISGTDVKAEYTFIEAEKLFNDQFA